MKKQTIDYDNDYYVHSIAHLLKLLNTKLSPSNILEKQYKEELNKVTKEIHENLQQMKIVDLLTDKILYPDYPKALSYEMSKLLPLLSNPTSDPLFSYYIKQTNDKSNHQIILLMKMQICDILKVKILMYYKIWQIVRQTKLNWFHLSSGVTHRLIQTK